LPSFVELLQLANGWHIPPVKLLLKQFELEMPAQLLHLQVPHVPPQSTPVSLPFLLPSEHVGAG